MSRPLTLHIPRDLHDRLTQQVAWIDGHGPEPTWPTAMWRSIEEQLSAAAINAIRAEKARRPQPHGETPMTMEPSPTVLQIYSERFATGDARSQPYKRGLLAALQAGIDRRPQSPPYPVGSAENDAWLAGYGEGREAAQHYRRKEA